MTIEEAAEQIRRQVELPEDVTVRPIPEDNGLLIGTDKLAFAITRQSIESGFHVRYAQQAMWTLKDLIQTTP